MNLQPSATQQKPSPQLSTLTTTVPPGDEDNEDNESMENIALFWGDGEHNNEHPQDFLNAIRRIFIMKPDTPDTQKLWVFKLHLKSGSAAEQWWDALPPMDKESWHQFCQAFDGRWPERTPTAKTVGEKLTELEHTTITEEEVGTRVRIHGMEEFAHMAWANRIKRCAAAILDTQGLLISTVRKAMPKVLWKVTGTTHTDWTSFCSAIHKVTLTQINKAKEEENETHKLHEEVKSLQSICNTLMRDIANVFQRLTWSMPPSAPRFVPPLMRPINTQIHQPSH
jgi:hypothetical protein